MEFKNELPNVVDRMIARKIARHTCQLVFKDKNGKLTSKGSGVLFVVKGVHFLLTASHLTQEWSNSNPLFIVVNNNHLIALEGDLREADFYNGKIVDLSYVKIAESILPNLQKSYTFLPYSKISENTGLTKGGNYSIIVYPENAEKAADAEIQTGAQAYYLEPSPQKMYGLHNLDPENYYLLDAKSNNTAAENAKIMTQLSNVDGSGLWLLTSEGNLEVSIDYKLIGIITKFGDSAHFTFIGMRLCLIIDMIRKLEKIEMQVVNEK